jgi:8-oxo-dGTP diphosphatase
MSETSKPAAIVVTAGVIRRGGRLLAARRKAGSHMERHWEFPGGKLEPNESPEEGLERELAEELGVQVRVGRILDAVFHRYPEKNVLLLFYACEIIDGEPRPIDCEELAWVRTAELEALDWAPADRTFVSKLTNHLEKETLPR